MKTSDLVFIGVKGSVVALNRATGAQVWATHLRGSQIVKTACAALGESSETLFK